MTKLPKMAANRYLAVAKPQGVSDHYSWSWAVSQRTQPHLLKFSFCRTCKVFQPPRCHHCSFCKTCVLELDHHCMWLGTCLGRRNYGAFYWFLLHLAALLTCELLFIAGYLWRLSL